MTPLFFAFTLFLTIVMFFMIQEMLPDDPDENVSIFVPLGMLTLAFFSLWWAFSFIEYVLREVC